MYAVDADETIHIYYERKPEKRPYTVLPLVCALFCLVGVAAVTLYSAEYPSYEQARLVVPALFLPPRTFTVSAPIVPTGVKTYPAITAHGVLTITNGSIIGQSIPAGFTVQNVATDAAVYVPPGSANGYGYATVSAHALMSGTGGNFARLAINQVIGSSLYIRNLSAFTGGKDAYVVKYATPEDKQAALLQARGILMNKSSGLHYPCQETKFSRLAKFLLREKLTLARQMIRDGLADVIIVFDLRRFSRNFVHSAMIFEEIESHGGEIVSVSENIDNSLTGKLIRSILAWSAESEREKIVEYANRHWQTRLEHGLPMGTGRAPFGWEWKDEDKTGYKINKEEATIRLSIFTMFVILDMSLRAIAHKLTEDRILTPAKARGVKLKKGGIWYPSTVHMILSDPANIGILQICKKRKVLTAKGTVTRVDNENMKTIPGGLPAIIPIELYERAQGKLKTNQVDKSHVHRNPEDFLLKGRIFCKTCNYRMVGRYRTSNKKHTYPFYGCVNNRNKYGACPDLPLVRTDKIDQTVWYECCELFEELDQVRDIIERNIEQSVHAMVDDTRGKQLITRLEEEIAQAKSERARHDEGSYLYTLITHDITSKQEQLKRAMEDYDDSRDLVTLADVYRQSILSFLNFLHVMRGNYHKATFKDKRNALEVLGVKVYIYPDTREIEPMPPVTTVQEWLSITEASVLTGIGRRTLQNRVEAGSLKTERRGQPWLVIHRDELNRLLREAPIRLRSTRETLRPRIEVTYQPMFTGVQTPLG